MGSSSQVSISNSPSLTPSTDGHQLDRPYNDTADAAYINAMHAKYPTPADMVRARADLIWRGGKPETFAGPGRDAAPSLD